jgi:hypothetical protein
MVSPPLNKRCDMLSEGKLPILSGVTMTALCLKIVMPV